MALHLNADAVGDCRRTYRQSGHDEATGIHAHAFRLSDSKPFNDRRNDVTGKGGRFISCPEIDRDPIRSDAGVARRRNDRQFYGFSSLKLIAERIVAHARVPRS